MPALAQGNCTGTKPSRPDCAAGISFLSELQDTLEQTDRDATASMVRYPLRVNSAGKTKLIKTKQELLKQYDNIFSPLTQCAITESRPEDVWGNYRGFMIGDGEVWWEASISKASSKSKPVFKIITINQESSKIQACAALASPAKEGH